MPEAARSVLQTHVILAGFMGTGKSTVGRWLAHPDAWAHELPRVVVKMTMTTTKRWRGSWRANGTSSRLSA